MLRKLGLLLSVSIILGGCSLIPKKSGIEVVSNPSAKIIIGGKDAGMTPYKNNSLKPGENEIKIAVSKPETQRRQNEEPEACKEDDAVKHDNSKEIMRISFSVHRIT